MQVAVRLSTFREILHRLWLARLWLVVLPLLGIILGLSVISFLSFRAERSVTNFIRLNNIEKANCQTSSTSADDQEVRLEACYPSGSQFSPRDIISPPVLERLRSELALPAGANLESALQANFDSPMAELVLRKYRERLAVRTLTQADINALNLSLAQEMDATVSKSVRIDVRFDRIGIDEAQGHEVAIALPRIWADVFTRQFRTLVSKELTASIPQATPAEFRNTAGIIAIASRLSEIQRGLKAIGDDRRLSLAQDTQGNSSEDLSQKLSIFREIYFGPLFAVHISDKSLVSEVFLKDQNLQIEDLQRQIAGLDEAVRRVQAYGGTNQASPEQGATDAGPAEVQLDAGALSQIVRLAERASVLRYLEELLTKRQHIVVEASAIQRDVGLFQTAPIIPVVDEGMIEHATRGYTDVVDRYNELLHHAKQLAEDRSGELFTTLTSPLIEGRLIEPQWLFLALGLALLGLFLALVYAIFVAPAAKDRLQ